MTKIGVRGPTSSETSPKLIKLFILFKVRVGFFVSLLLGNEPPKSPSVHLSVPPLPDLVLHILRAPTDVLPNETISDVMNIFNFDTYYTQPDRHFAVDAKGTETKRDYRNGARKFDRKFALKKTSAAAPV